MQNDTLVERLIAASEWVKCGIIALRTHPDFETATTEEAAMARSVVETLEEDGSDILAIVRELLQRRVNAGFYVTPTGGGNVQDNKAPSDIPE